MEQIKYHSRNIFDLTNQELIRLVDFFINSSNLDRIAHSLYSETQSTSRRIEYRKIEIQYAYYESAYAVVISLRFTGLDRDVKTGFMMYSQGDAGENDNTRYELDFQIGSIKGFFEPFQDLVLRRGIHEEYGIEFDYSHLLVFTKELYTFLDTDLRMWSAYLAVDKYVSNPQLIGLYQQGQPESFVIEEVDIVNHPDRIKEISK